MGRFISDELFHFVGRSHPEEDDANYLVLKKILTSKRILHRQSKGSVAQTHVKVDLARTLIDDSLVIPSVTCYCDIPYEHLDIHVAKYGRFGLSFERHTMSQRGARPVVYIPYRPLGGFYDAGSQLLRDIEATYRGFIRQIYEPLKLPDRTSRSVGREPKTLVEAAIALDSMLKKNLIAFIKAFNAELPEDHIDYFYSEREWRMYGHMQFLVGDVRTIAVASEKYRERLMREIPEYSDSRILVLTS